MFLISFHSVFKIKILRNVRFSCVYCIYDRFALFLLFFLFKFIKYECNSHTDSGFGTGKGSSSSNSQNRIMSSDSALFTTRNNTKVIAQKGGLAVLPCAVKWNPTATVCVFSIPTKHLKNK